MTSRVRILPYGPSDSCNALKEAIRQWASENRVNVSIQNLLSEGSIFRARPTDVIINYGNRRYPESFFGQASVLNPVAALNRAANKLTAFQVMQERGVKTVEFTSDLAVAMGWHENSIVYARSTLTGHSGEGITVHVPQDGSVIAGGQPLYTRGIQGQRREWRVHIFKGNISYVQKKIRRNGYREDPNYREDVRNHHTGWVYSNQFSDTPNDQVLANAALAVEAMGLDFGAVDVISRGDQAWVLEVNTAPGLSGTTLETYQRNVVEYVKSMDTNYTPQYVSVYEVPVLVAEVEDPAPEVIEEAPPVAESEAAPAVSRSVGTPPTQEETLVENAVSHQTSFPRGFYTADMLHPYSGQVMASNVILFSCGRNMYRHGWNHAVPTEQFRNAVRITSVVLENGSTVETN